MWVDGFNKSQNLKDFSNPLFVSFQCIKQIPRNGNEYDAMYCFLLM